MAIADSLSRASATTPQILPVQAAVGAACGYFLLLSAFGLAALVLGIQNRLTPDLFPVAPPVDVLPPLGEAAWYRAFAVHQQDPIFAACGGAESLAQFKLLYWWEWLRRASFMLLSTAFSAGFLVAATLGEFRFMVRRHVLLGLIGLGYVVALRVLDAGVAAVPDLARYNTGQYRHAIDMTFWSVALALAMASALVPPAAARRGSPRALVIVSIALIGLAICSGALFASRDAITVWRSFPGYEGSLAPPLDRLTAYAPAWLNFTFNQYTIQLVHRVVAMGLGVVLIAYGVGAVRDRRLRVGAGLLLALIAGEIALGAVMLGLVGLRAGFFVSAALAHELGAVVLLAAALAISLSASAPPRWEGANPRRRRARCL
jgi:cytochrome c oxidase assembly protein subunit 15